MKKLRILLPKGRLFKNIKKLFLEAGYIIRVNGRSYIPQVNDPELEAKLIKPQNIPQIIEIGSHDIGFTGYDWVIESGAKIKNIMDLGFDPVKIVAAVPAKTDKNKLLKKKIVVASEYENISKKYLEEKKYDYIFVRTFGATEVFPPDDADMIIDNSSTGNTLKEHNLTTIDTILDSSTCFIANKNVFKDLWKKQKIEEIKMLFQSVIDARKRVMLEMNVPNGKLDKMVKELPCMRAPTISLLHEEQGYAIKIAVEKSKIARLIPKLKKMGATDILEFNIRKVVI